MFRSKLRAVLSRLGEKLFLWVKMLVYFTKFSQLLFSIISKNLYRSNGEETWTAEQLQQAVIQAHILIIVFYSRCGACL